MEEQQEQLKIESKRISDLRAEVNQLKVIVKLLSSLAAHQGQLLMKAGRVEVIRDVVGKAASAKIGGLDLELKKRLHELPG